MPQDGYSSERYDPTLPYCGGISLKFDGKKLYLTGISNKKSINVSYNAVSGKQDAKGKFDYSKEAQKKSKAGPIPEGKYWIAPEQFWTNAWYKRAPTTAWGNHRITIHPFKTTETHGRGGFFIHGGINPGSSGCIDLTADIDKFYKDINYYVKDYPSCYIQLVVDYSS